MYFVAYKIKAVAFFALIDVVADDDFDFAVKDISELFALVRHVFLKRRIRLDFDINRLHLVLLTVWHKPDDFLPVDFLFKKVVARKHDLFGFVFAEKGFQIASECHHKVVQGGNCRHGQVVFELAYVAFREFAPVGKFLLRQSATKPQIFQFGSDFHISSCFRAVCLVFLNLKIREFCNFKKKVYNY